MAKMSFTTEPARRRIERIQALLRQQALCVYEIADGIFCCSNTAYEYVWHLHGQKMIHVSGWRRYKVNGKTYLRALYAWGKGKDVKKPDYSSAEAQRKRRHEMKESDPEAYARFLARLRHYKWKPHCDPAAAWIPKKHAHSTCDSAAVGM